MSIENDEDNEDFYLTIIINSHNCHIPINIIIIIVIIVIVVAVCILVVVDVKDLDSGKTKCK